MSADSSSPTSFLATPIQYAPGVGPRRAEGFERLGIHTIADLIKHLPHRYELEAAAETIADLREGAIGTVIGTITQCRWIPTGGSPIGRGRGRGGRFTATLEDDRGCLELVWFNAGYLRQKIHPGLRVRVSGKVGQFRETPQMANPNWRSLEDDEPTDADVPAVDRYRPVYPATEGLPSEAIDRVVRSVLTDALPGIEDHLDEVFRTERALPDLRTAYRLIHAPQDADEVAAGRRRLAYDELLMLQLGFAIRRRHREHDLTSPPLRVDDAVDRHIRERFPFALTDAQNRVVQEIAKDLGRAVPMNRLVQGDVGSGKTVVALYALLCAVASGKQGALMAPTELLAEQHYLSCMRMLDGSSVRLAILTGSLTTAERQAITYRIERGEVDIVVGTQALIQSSVRFADLAVVVVDEQHRFGVEQRAAIRGKSEDQAPVPHTLVMTATPIPRTLSLSLFGDLDVSTIDALPPGRKPIKTRVVTPDKSDEVYAWAAERAASGEQAYVVLPAIDEDGRGLKSVRAHAAMLAEGPFAGRSVAAVHGRLKRLTRERIMDRFRRGKIDVLVATTVIEVGVDVPNATLMIVEHAERFGLAQLHQLRGRVGRGERESVCVFIAETGTDDAVERMAAIARTTDGFEIAAADLRIRGIGDFFGTRQSGLPPLRVADLERHHDLLRLARRDAQARVDADPQLTQPSHDLLRRRLIKQLGPDLGLADVG